MCLEQVHTCTHLYLMLRHLNKKYRSIAAQLMHPASTVLLLN